MIGENLSLLLVAIPLAASVGGMGTIIGSAPNAIAAGVAAGFGKEINFVEWMVIGAPVALGLVVLPLWWCVRADLHAVFYLLVIASDNMAEKRYVELGPLEQDQMRVVTGGLEPTDRFRGMFGYDSERCIDCALCAKACPIDIIYLV